MASKSPEYISAGEKKGLIFGSLLAAGMAAATGGNSKEALLKAAMGASGAYAGGMQDLYNRKEQQLRMEKTNAAMEAAKEDAEIRHMKTSFDMERQRTIDAATLGQIAAQENRATSRETREGSIYNQGLQQKKERDAAIDMKVASGELDRATGTIMKAQPIGGAMPYIMPKPGTLKDKTSRTKTANFNTFLTSANKIVPKGFEDAAGNIDRNSYKIRQKIIHGLAASFEEDPTLIKDAERTQQVISQLYRNEKTPSFQGVKINQPPAMVDTMSGFSFPNNVAKPAVMSQEDQEAIKLYNSGSPEQKQLYEKIPEFQKIKQQYGRLLR